MTTPSCGISRSEGSLIRIKSVKLISLTNIYGVKRVCRPCRYNRIISRSAGASAPGRLFTARHADAVFQNAGLNANFACIAGALEKSAFVADEIERGDRNEDSGPEISG